MCLPDVENQDAGDISKKEVAERLRQNNFHAAGTFSDTHQMRRQSTLEGA